MLKKMTYIKFTIVGFFVMALWIIFANTKISFAEDKVYDEYDKCLINVLNETAEETYGNCISFISSKDIVYDVNLYLLGFIYDFTINGENGYAIVINANDTVDVSELFFNTENPYQNVANANKIYTNYFEYLYLKDNQIYNVKNNLVISNNVLNIIKDNAFYSGNTEFAYSIEKINYTNKIENEHHLAKRHPYLVDLNDLANECGAIAGANIIQYWDRYYKDLIPNFESGKLLGSSFIYNGPNQKLNDVIIQIYADMETNKSAPGTSLSQFKIGLEKYVKTHGNYNIKFNSCMDVNTINTSKIKQFLDYGQPVVLFLDGYSVVDILQDEKCDTYEYATSIGSHVMVGFGYKEIAYKLQNNQIKNEFLIEIATGIKNKGKGYINIQYNSNVDNAFGILIN